MKQTSILKGLIVGFLSVSALSMHAAIQYTEWTPDSVSGLIYDAQKNKQMMVVVVTQPDWCPPCIVLENKIIKNQQEKEFSGLAKDWTVLEVYGYDKAGADFLKAQNLKFHGTPTVFMLDPKYVIPDDTSLKADSSRLKLKNKKPELKLGDLKVVHSIAGMPDDFSAQFIKAANGYDLVAEAQKTLREEQTLEAYRALATAYVDQGKVKQANRVYQTMLFRDDLLDEEVQDIKWEQISQVLQRVEKDHAATVKAIDEFVDMYPEYLEDSDHFEDYAYKRAWSLVAIDRAAEAKDLLRKAYVLPNDVSGLKTYLYFAFRNPDPILLADAVQVSNQALQDFPESEMSLTAAQGRLMRRLGNLEQAKALFARAVELAVDDEEAKEIYIGQLKFVEQQLAKTTT